MEDTILNEIENIYVAEGIDNIILDGNKIDFDEYKTITIDDVNHNPEYQESLPIECSMY